VILAIGFSFYFVSVRMIDGIYASSLSGDQKLLNAIGISSFSSLSEEEIQRRVDDQIRKYSTLLNSKSRTLSYMKSTLQNVNDFHFSFYALQDVLEKMKGELSLSYLAYSTKASSSIEMVQFALENSDAFEKEKEYFEKYGIKLQQVENAKSKWYKTVSEKVYLSRGAK
jgi:hypothetical protein